MSSTPSRSSRSRLPRHSSSGRLPPSSSSSSSSRWSVPMMATASLSFLVGMSLVVMLRQQAFLSIRQSTQHERDTFGMSGFHGDQELGSTTHVKIHHDDDESTAAPTIGREVVKKEKIIKTKTEAPVRDTKSHATVRKPKTKAPAPAKDKKMPDKDKVDSTIVPSPKKETSRPKKDKALTSSATNKNSPKVLPTKSSWWRRLDTPFKFVSVKSKQPALVPFDLSVNHLQVIAQAAGAIPEQVHAAEDFLPIVLKDHIQLRFRLKPVPGASAYAIKDVSAYQIEAKYAYSNRPLWDSGKVKVVDTMPDAIAWEGPELAVGTIVEWKVSVWDFNNVGPATSELTKFGVGPSNDEFEGKWIVHPTDASLFKKNEIQEFWYGTKENGCKHWKKRRPLPLARARIKLAEKEADEIVSAMLVVSGLGSFSVSVDGKQLSSSSALDPPLTDFTQRISYRGFDVTSFFAGKKNVGTHVVGVTLGSGWWDPRPIQGGIIKHNLLPRGPLTTVAELHVTLNSGTTKVLAPSGGDGGDWQMAKGYILDSDLFTGEVVHLGTKKELESWDAPAGWTKSKAADSGTPSISWVEPVSYSSNTETSKWRAWIAARATEQKYVWPEFDTAPIGKLVPIEAQPVMPVERIEMESVTDLGDGRWLLDFGKAISGVVRFEDGLPTPIKPSSGYPRSHYYPTDDEFVSVVYGESLEMETGDINLVLVAGMGLHDGGPRERSTDTQERGGPCFPKDHGYVLTQRDVYVAPKKGPGSFKDARQSLFTTHGFRFAEVCCTEEPPTNAYALMYRTAFAEWGKFDSSHVLLNGAYELTKNAFNSNMQGVQSDCPHREKLQYGGDLMANSPAAMHLFDLGAFYNKVIHDWTDVQWDNGAYTETTPWHDLNDYAGIGKGAGETVWGSLPTVLTVRHMQHYGEEKLMEDTFDHHREWMKFLRDNWESVDWENLEGLGDWLAIHDRDTFLTHHAYFMAVARSVAYIANKLIAKSEAASSVLKDAKVLAKEIQTKMINRYMKGGKSDRFDFDGGLRTPSSDIALYARIVPGDKRCSVLKHWLRRAGSGYEFIWPGDEESLFLAHLKPKHRESLLKLGLAKESEDHAYQTLYKEGRNTPEGILAIRYALKTMSDMGFHHVALNKVTGMGCPSFEYMLSHNATTMWETWWRSEDVFSRNHPMLGGVAEWLPSSVAGVSLAPSTTGGRELLFWPRIPTTALVLHASATQGTKRGDASIAWRFEGVPKDVESLDRVEVTLHMRIVVPPSSSAVLRIPTRGIGSRGIGDGGVVTMQYARSMPDLEAAKSSAETKCMARRKEGKGFEYNWEYDAKTKEWDIYPNGKAIGTPCESYLFEAGMDSADWHSSDKFALDNVDKSKGMEILVEPGLYDLTITKWELVQEKEVKGEYHPDDLGPDCGDTDTFDWDLSDASYII